MRCFYWRNVFLDSSRSDLRDVKRFCALEGQ
jgi:hypothetical protein